MVDGSSRVFGSVQPQCILNRVIQACSQVERKNLAGGDGDEQQVGPIEVTEDLKMLPSLTPSAAEDERKLPRCIGPTDLIAMARTR